MPSRTVLLAGLPGSGKTTYLAAIFHLLRTGSANAANLVMPELPEDRDYLMEAESAWLRLEALTRTVTASPGGATITVVRDGAHVQLSIPDIRGEDYEHLWEYGTTADRLAEVVGMATGIMLFVRANDVVAPAFLDENVEVVDGTTFELDDWQPEGAPTQTKLCDVLEQLRLLIRAVPIAVVVTAWDTVGEGETAEAWLQRRMPLLWQLLDCSASSVSVYGVSAQGGDLSDPDELRALASLPSSTTRIAEPAVRRGDDLTAPIAWLLSEGMG